MSAIELVRPEAHGVWQRITNVFRLHFVNVSTVIVLPWIIMGVIFLANLIIWLAIRASVPPGDEVPEQFWSGGVTYIFVYMLVVAIQSISATFPYAQGLSITRRDYSLGTGIAFVALSAGYAIALAALSSIEDLTNGWWLGGRVFAAFSFGDDGLIERLLVNFLGLLFFFFIGSLFGAVWVRWRTWGLLSLGSVLLIALVGTTAIITITGSWPAVAAWFVATGPIGLAAWTLVPTVLAAVIGFAVMRRATPRA